MVAGVKRPVISEFIELGFYGPCGLRYKYRCIKIKVQVSYECLDVSRIMNNLFRHVSPYNIYIKGPTNFVKVYYRNLTKTKR